MIKSSIFNTGNVSEEYLERKKKLLNNEIKEGEISTSKKTESTPTFKTAEEALEYAKQNNIKVANTNVKPTLASTKLKSEGVSVSEKIILPPKITTSEGDTGVTGTPTHGIQTLPKDVYNLVGSIGYGIGSIVAKPVTKGIIAVGDAISGKKVDMSNINNKVAQLEQSTIQQYGNNQGVVGVSKIGTEILLAMTGSNALKGLGLTPKVATAIAYAGTAGLRAMGDKDNVKDVGIETLKGGAYGLILGDMKKIMAGKALTTASSKTAMQIIVETSANFAKNAFAHAIASGGTQALDILKDDPNYDYIDWNQVEKLLNEGKYNSFEEFVESEDYKKMIIKNRGTQIMWSAIIGGVFDTISDAYTSKKVQTQLYGDKQKALKTLGLSSNATEAEIKQAHRKLSKMYHPDNSLTKNEAKFIEVQQAYSTLINKGYIQSIVQNTTKQTAQNGTPTVVKPQTPITNMGNVANVVSSAGIKANVTNLPNKTVTTPNIQKNEISQNNEDTTTLNTNELANKDNTSYNQIKGGVLDGEQRNVERNRMGLLQLVNKESARIGETEKKIQTQIIKNITEEQKKISEEFGNKIGKTINYFNGKDGNVKGLVTPTGIYIDNETSIIYGSDFMLGHEIAEDMLYNHTDVVIDGYSEMIKKIKDSKGFTKLFQDYTEGMTSAQKQKLTLNLDKVAKEILCDINAGKNGANTTVSKYVTNIIKSNLEPQLYNEIVEALNKYEKQIYETKNSEQQGSNFMPKNIQGLENYTEKEIKNIVSDYIQNLIPDIAIKEIELNGSRMRGDAKISSDLDVVVEYNGDISEDDLFNILNEDSLEIDGIKVDINPITASKSGTMTEYMKKSKEYDDSLKKQDEQRYDAISEKDVLKDTDMSYNTKDGFYSQLENTIINKMPRQASSKDVMNLIQKNGVKQDEIAWTGIDDYLASKETVTKEEVLEYIRANQIEIEEVVKDDSEIKQFEQREDEIRKKMDDLYYEAFKIAEKYDIYMKRGNPFETILNFLEENEDTKIYNIVDLNNFAEKGKNEYYLEGEEGEYFTLEEMHKDIDNLLDMYYENDELEQELEQIPETSYGYGEEFETSTKYRKYATDWSGADNYREILFTTPNTKGVKEFSSVHWGEKNILAHTRLQDYKDKNGDNVLFIEEIQSDMHQIGRKHGYGRNLEEIEKKLNDLNDEYSRLRKSLVGEQYQNIVKINERQKEIDDEMGKIIHKYFSPVIDDHDVIEAFYDIIVTLELKTDEQSNTKSYSGKTKIDLKYLQDKDIEPLKGLIHLSQEDLKQYVSLHNEMYRNSKTARKINKETNEILDNNEELKRLDREIAELKEEQRSVYGKIDSKFPFKKNWHEFVLRKIINEAVQQGYDKVAWTTGKQQNDRYDLSKYIDEIEYAKNDDGTHDIYVNKRNQIVKSFHNQTEKQLEELIGKELTNKIVNDEGKIKYPKETDSKYEREIYSLSGLDLEIGGEGMKGFYDKIIPEYLNKYLKKWESKVEEVIIPDGLKEHKQQGFAITPKMVEAVKTVGQPLYEKTTEGQRANINRVRNAVMDILGVEETGNKEVLDAMAVKVNYALNRNILDDNEIKRIVNDVSSKLVNVVEPSETENKIKSIIKETKIYVPESVKKDIADWNAYRKSLFGTLKLTNDKQGISIDSFYKELNEIFGEVYFPSNIVNETEELKKIAEVAKTLKTKRVKFEEYFKEEYGKEAWKEVLEDIEKELKDIREEVSYETNEKSDELKLTPELFTALNNVGIPIEMLEQDKNEWVKGIAQFFSDDYKYYEQNLKDIEKQNHETGTRTTNYILNKRRIDVLLGRTPRNEKYSGGVSPRDIRENIEKSINKKIGTKGFRAKAYGVYKPNVDVIRVKDISNIETELHELGHRIDFKVLNNIINNESIKFRKELNSLSQRAFLNTYDTPEMKRLTKQIAKTKETIKNLEKYLDVRNMSKRANPNAKVRQNARARLEKARMDLPILENELEKAIVSNANEDNMREGWAEATKRFVVDNENFIREYPETAKYILNEMNNNKTLNKQLTDLINLAEKYINSTSEEQVSAIVSVGEDTDKQDKRKFFDQYMYQMHDDLWDIKKLQKNISKAKGEKYYKTRAEDNLYTLMRLNKANEDVIVNSLKYGIIDDRGNRLTKGISDIIEKMTPENYMKIRNFMVARRTLDYFAKGLDSGVQVADTIALINHYSKDKKLVQMANDLTEMQNKTLEYLGQDFMDKEDMKELRKWNRLYIPMKRVFDGKVNSSTGGKQLSKLTKERTGSQRDIIDPLESIIQNTAMLINKKRQNDWLKKVAEQINESGYADIAEEIDPPQALKAEVSLELFKNALEEQGIDTDEIDLEVVARIFNPKLNDEATMTMGFMDNGKLRAIQFKDKNVYKIVSEGTGNKMSDLLELADKVTGLLRLGATQANLEFAIPNVISDTMGAWIYSESGFVPAVDSIKGVIDYMMANYDWANNMVKNTEYGKNNKYMYDLYMQSGATMSTRVASYRPEVQNYLREIFGKNATKVYSKDKKVSEKAVKDIWEAIKKAPNSVQDLLTAIPELSEQGTRFANFKKDYNYFRKKGYNHKNALVQSAINTRDITTDFNRMGNYFRVYNRLKAFSSARAQSIYRFAEGIAKMPKKVLSKVGIMVAISMAILKASIDADRKEYEEIADQTRKDNFIITLPNGELLKIKKPQGTVRSIINFFELLYGVGTGIIPKEEYEKEWNNWLRDTVEENSGIELDLREGRDIWQITSGAFLPTVLEPIIENSQNVDFYYGNPIIPYGKENLRPQDQYDENTSQTAIMLGEIFNTSPAKLENLITGWFAGVGQQALNISDTVLGKLSKDIPEQPAKDKSDEFILKRFFADPYNNSGSVSEIYDKAEKLAQLKEYNEATEGELETLKKLEQAKDTMSDLNKKIKETRNSLSLNAEEKKDKINELQELRTDTARYYLGKDLINEKNKTQIELYEYYPASNSYVYQVNKLTKVTVEFNEEDKKKYAEICKEEYEDAISKLEKKASYKKASTEEQEKMRASELTKARNTAKETVSKEVYKRNKGAK